MSARAIGPQDECVQCGESKEAIKESQRKGGQDQIYCAIVDYWGECSGDWERHRFVWTEKDQSAAEDEEAHWAKQAQSMVDWWEESGRKLEDPDALV